MFNISKIAISQLAKMYYEENPSRWGWYATQPKEQSKTIPTYADIRQAQVLDGLKKVRAAETLIEMKKFGKW